MGFFPCSCVKPPQAPAFSCDSERKRALVRSSLALGPVCQQRSSFRAVTGCRNPPELRDFTAATADGGLLFPGTMICVIPAHYINKKIKKSSLSYLTHISPRSLFSFLFLSSISVFQSRQGAETGHVSFPCHSKPSRQPLLPALPYLGLGFFSPKAKNLIFKNVF